MRIQKWVVRRGIVAFIFLIVLLIFELGFVAAAPILSEYQLNITDKTNPTSTAYRGQIFQIGAVGPEISGKITNIELWLSKTAEANFTVQLRAVNSTGLPNSTIFDMGSFDSHSITNAGWYNISLTRFGNYVPGIPYAFTFFTNETATSVSANFTDNGGNYPYNFTSSGNSGTSWSFSSVDMAFRIYVNESTIVTTNEITYNQTVYETETNQLLKANFTIPNNNVTSAVLIYNGTRYSSTIQTIGPNNIVSNLIDISTVGASVTRYFLWELNLTNSSIVNSTTSAQTVNNITLAQCSPTIATPYVNFTFKDESTLVSKNASLDSSVWSYYIGSGDGTITKSLSFSNSTANPRYAFCFNPQSRSLKTDLTFKYSGTGYPQRTYSLSAGTLTNSTTNTVLYMLASADGIYSAYQIMDAATNNQIEGATVTVEREIGGTWTTIEQGTSDSAGLVTFWLNPNYDHRITASKTGYGTTQVTIRPSQTTYTIFLGTSSLNITNYRYKNILYRTYPAPGILSIGTTYRFGFNITASDGNVVTCKIEIKNKTLDVVATNTGCNAYGGNISVSYNTGSNTNLYGYYYVNLGSGYELLKANDLWIIENVTSSGSAGLVSFFEEMRDLPEWGDSANRKQFSLIVFFFFFMILVIGLFTYFVENSLSNVGIGLLVFWAFIAVGSFAGILTIDGISPYTWFNKYIIGLITSFLVVGYYINYTRREAT